LKILAEERGTAAVHKCFTSNIPGGGSMGYILKMQKYVELKMWTTKRRRDIKFPRIDVALTPISYMEDSRRVEYEKLKRQTVREQTAELSLWKFSRVLCPGNAAQVGASEEKGPH
jgi:hypothetical protein